METPPPRTKRTDTLFPYTTLFRSDKIESLLVTGKGRFDRKNLLLGKEGNKPDLSVPSNPVFACGTIICKETEIDVLIHEEFDDEIEFDITDRKSTRLNSSH